MRFLLIAVFLLMSCTNPVKKGIIAEKIHQTKHDWVVTREYQSEEAGVWVPVRAETKYIDDEDYIFVLEYGSTPYIVKAFVPKYTFDYYKVGDEFEFELAKIDTVDKVIIEGRERTMKSFFTTTAEDAETGKVMVPKEEGIVDTGASE